MMRWHNCSYAGRNTYNQPVSNTEKDTAITITIKCVNFILWLTLAWNQNIKVSPQISVYKYKCFLTWVSLNSVCRWSTATHASSHSYLCSLQVLAFGFRLKTLFPAQTPLLTVPMESVTETLKLDGKKQYRFLLARGRSISKRIW